MKRIISFLMSMVMMLSLITVSPITVEAASNIKINGVDIGYAVKDYFSKNGKACTCHNQGLCIPETSACNCIRVNGTVQCYAFALHCQNKLFGYNDVSSPKEFKSIGSISAGKLTVSNLKELILSAPIGSHIRTYYVDKSHCAHSMILIEKNDKGFTIVQANGSNNEEYSGHYKCRIGTAEYTWDEYINSGYGCRGIQFVKIPKDYEIKPSAPTITSATAKSSTSIEVKWNAVSGATKYRVDRRRSDETGWEGRTLTSNCKETSYTDTGLEANKKYYYRVYAINDAGTSPTSVTYQTWTMTNTPNQPDVNRDSESQLTISWDKVSGAEEYKLLYRKATDEGYSILANNLTSTSYIHKNLSAGTKYCYRIVAVNKGEVGPEGDRKAASIDSEQSPTKSKFTKLARPSNSINNDNINQVNLEWKAAVGDSTYKYEVWRDGAKIATTSSLKYTDTSATSGKIHTYQVKVIDTKDNNNNITSSDAFYAASKIEPAVTVTPQSATSMKISWNKPTGASNLSYTVMRQINDGTSVEIKTVKDTYYVDSGLTTGATYGYYVKVLDNEGNYLTSIRGKDAVMQILPTSVALNRTTSTLKVGETLSLTATITPSDSTNKTLSWTSSDTNVATVSNGESVLVY